MSVYCAKSTFDVISTRFSFSLVACFVLFSSFSYIYKKFPNIYASCIVRSAQSGIRNPWVATAMRLHPISDPIRSDPLPIRPLSSSICGHKSCQVRPGGRALVGIGGRDRRKSVITGRNRWSVSYGN